MGLIKAAQLLLKGKKSMGVIKKVTGGVESITGVAPFSKTGGKTVAEWKSKVSNKKFNDAIKEAGAQITGKLKKTAAELEKLNKTLKKQKKILDD